ncbi:SUMF1/EgtB/PvdO family nonheme iron enzyme [Kiritimatiellaeota bacterium B1221]|nr:SUMF1/EgtB/PvdO family nonheme iron enzyme [Kiritimatiellaeota bacterium B1221]
MNARSLPLLFVPILGSLLAWIFRPSEVDWQTLESPVRLSLETKDLHIPKGPKLRFICIPETGDALSLIEIPSRVLSLYPGETQSYNGALAFTHWISERTGKTLRLPSAEEWRRAARAGISNAEFPWGFGPPIPPGNLHFALDKAPNKPGPAFGYGFRDLAGGKWEWTLEGILLGSAWSEQDPQTLYINHQFTPPANYAGKDTAIRLLWENPHHPLKKL